MKSTVIYNDGQNIGKGFKEALRVYKIESVAQSKRGDYIRKIAPEFQR